MITTGRAAVVIAAMVAISGTALRAEQTASSVLTRARLDTILNATPDTPNQQALLVTAVGDARTAMAQAVGAEKAGTDLAAVRQFAVGAMHALDPSLQKTGPGTGYGLRRAVAELVAQLEATTATDQQPDAVRLLPPALTAAQEVSRATDALLDVVQRLAVTSTATDAAALSRQARELAGAILAGPHVDPAGTTRRLAGGLAAVQSRLAILYAGREKTLPASLRQSPERRR